MSSIDEELRALFRRHPALERTSLGAVFDLDIRSKRQFLVALRNLVDYLDKHGEGESDAPYRKRGGDRGADVRGQNRGVDSENREGSDR